MLSIAMKSTHQLKFMRIRNAKPSAPSLNAKISPSPTDIVQIGISEIISSKPKSQNPTLSPKRPPTATHNAEIQTRQNHPHL